MMIYSTASIHHTSKSKKIYDRNRNGKLEKHASSISPQNICYTLYHHNQTSAKVKTHQHTRDQTDLQQSLEGCVLKGRSVLSSNERVAQAHRSSSDTDIPTEKEREARDLGARTLASAQHARRGNGCLLFCVSITPPPSNASPAPTPEHLCFGESHLGQRKRWQQRMRTRRPGRRGR